MAAFATGCDFRIRKGKQGWACLRVREITGIGDPDVAAVNEEICHACRNSLRWDEPVNPVIASVAFGSMSGIIEQGGHRECDVKKAIWLRQCLAGQMSIELKRLPGETFPPQRSTTNPIQGHWAVAVMTAPRKVSTIGQAIESIREAGFPRLRIFAEPNSDLPEEGEGIEITRRGHRLGTMVNFYSALVNLYIENPEADRFAVFQDDILVAKGAREWCDRELWPNDSGIVSLFTPRIHLGDHAGWRSLSPGYQRVCGAQALVLRKDIVERFLSDPGVLHRLTARRHNNDAVLAGWAAREGEAIAYHTPSLVGHIGDVSSLYRIGPDRRNSTTPVGSVEEVSKWSKGGRSSGSIGLIGWNTATGLGYQNRDLVRYPLLKKWLIPRHNKRENLEVPEGFQGEARWIRDRMSDDEIRDWVGNLDWLLFVERPYVKNMARVAAQSGAGIACIPNWEWTQPDLRWLPFVDLMICPTRFTKVLMDDWKQRFGFGYETRYLPWPIEVDRFPFREREVCRRFLFVNGWGGSEIVYPDGSPVPYRRKGWELILEAARRAPDLNFIVYSQKNLRDQIPSNIEMRLPPARNADLFLDGDVCVQPSHFEGLGLQLLECQAAGLPLITTDAAPMNEHYPWKVIPTSDVEVIDTGPGPIHSWMMDPDELVSVLRSCVEEEIGAASRGGRELVRENHNWAHAFQFFSEHLVKR